MSVFNQQAEHYDRWFDEQRTIYESELTTICLVRDPARALRESSCPEVRGRLDYGSCGSHKRPWKKDMKRTGRGVYSARMHISSR